VTNVPRFAPRSLENRSRRLALHALAIVFVLLLGSPVAASAAGVVRPSAEGPHGRRGAGMARIPAGRYMPLYGTLGERSVRVGEFALDREPVTRGEFLAFVREHPAWRRGSVRRLFAEPGYLAEWTGVLDAGDAADLRRPVTSVSWFAARAYCAAQGKRLPTVDEWEYAAQASATRRDASRDPEFRKRILDLYTSRRSDAFPPVGSGQRNVYGVRDLHESAWEWTEDFNGVLVPDDSRDTGSGAGARDHQLFCASAAIGAADPSNYPAFLRYAFRAGLTARSTLRTLGFRCASSAAGA
jgi:formylglycine-generating enzyme required for sulfatase activity